MGDGCFARMLHVISRHLTDVVFQGMHRYMSGKRDREKRRGEGGEEICPERGSSGPGRAISPLDESACFAFHNIKIRISSRKDMSHSRHLATYCRNISSKDGVRPYPAGSVNSHIRNKR